MVNPDVTSTPASTSPVSDLAAFRARRDAGGQGPAGRPPGGPLPLGTVTFLLAEVVSAGEDGSCRPALEAAVAAHHGVCPVEHGGTSTFVAAFELASDAIAAALAAQLDMTSAAVRMALHTGDAQVVDGRYSAGTAIRRCARLRGLAHGGQILVSGPAADVLADRLPAGSGLLPVGLHRLRDHDRPLQVYQLAHADLPVLFPPLRTSGAGSTEPLPANLPVPLTRFVGREGDRADLVGLLAGHRLVTLAGTGGTGKTRLAAQAAADVADAYPGGLWWVDLAPVADPDGVSWAVLAALGLGDDRGLDPVERVCGYVGDGRVLLVFDNCEHVLDQVAVTLERLLRACPALTVLATSREPLGVPGEVVRRVAPLGVPEVRVPEIRRADPDLTAEALATYDGVRLFCERAGDARPSFTLDAANVPVVAAICARLDGLPLALELAAAWLRTLSPEHVLAGLDDRFRLLTTAGSARRTLEASVEWSHELLGPGEQVLFRRLAVCSGWFDLDAAEAVGVGPYENGASVEASVEDWEVPDLLGDLVDKSLVLFDGERYRLLQTLQAFAAARLRDAGETAAARERHFVHFLGRAEAAAQLHSRELRPHLLSALTDDHDNLRAALAWSALKCSTGLADPDPALRLVVALGSFWYLHGHFTEGLAWHRRVLALVPEDVTPMRCRAISGLGYLSLNCAELSNGMGIGELTEAISLARRLDDPGLAARPLAALGAVQSFGLPGDPEATLREAVEAGRRGGGGWDLWCALWWQAFYWVYTRNRPAAAAPILAELDAIGRRAENDSCLGWNEVVRLIAAWQEGRVGDARTTVDVVLDMAYRCGEPLLESHALTFGADALIGTGEYAEAEALGMRTVARLHRSLDACRQGFAEFGLARLALARGDLASATRQADAVAGLLRQTGFPLLIQQLCQLRGRVALERGDAAAAREGFAEAAASAQGTGVPWDLATAQHHLGLLAVAERDPAAAAAHLHGALAIEVEHGFRGLATDALETLATVCAPPQAARLLGAAATLREETGMVRRPLDTPAYDALVARVHAALGDPEVARLWAEGALTGIRTPIG